MALLTERYGSASGTVLELQGDLGQNVAQLRGGGFNDYLADYPDIEVISRPTEWRAENFSQMTLDVASSTELDAIYMHSDCVGTKVVTAALDQIGQLMGRGEEGHIFLLGVDGCPDALESIRMGYSDQASSQPLPDFGIITDWIEMEMAGEMIETGDVIQEGAPWSPASITDSDTGYMLNLATTSVNPDNVVSDALWGNQAGRRRGRSRRGRDNGAGNGRRCHRLRRAGAERRPGRDHERPGQCGGSQGLGGHRLQRQL